jgi:hypothetical protein
VTNADRLESYRVRSAQVYAADPKGWQWRAEKGARYQDWLRQVAFRCAWIRPRAKVVPIDVARMRRGKR